MKQKGEKERAQSSATITQTLCLISGFSLILMVASYAVTTPGWWSGVLNGHGPNDYMVANQGQLKLFTERAVSQLNTTFSTSGGAGPALSNLVYGWQQDYATNGYGPSHLKPSDYRAINLGQLKYVASLVDGQLAAAGYTGLTPAWLQPNSNTDYLAANIGQMKQAFDFDLSVAPGAITNLQAVAGAPGEIDLSWTNPKMNNATSMTLEYSTDGGTTWTTVTLAPNTTSYSLTGLDPDLSYTVQVIPGNSVGSNTPPPPPPPVTPPPSPRYAVIDLGANFYPVQINNSNVVVGNGPSGGNPSVPEVWGQGVLSPLSISYSGWTNFTVVGLDDGGHMIGNMYSINPAPMGGSGNMRNTGCYWSDTNKGTAPIPLGPTQYANSGAFGAGYSVEARAISHQGNFIVGFVGVPVYGIHSSLVLNPGWTDYSTNWWKNPCDLTGNDDYAAQICRPGSAAGTSSWCGQFQFGTSPAIINGVGYTNYPGILCQAINDANIVAAYQGTNADIVIPVNSTTLAITNIGSGFPAALNNLPMTSTNAPQIVGVDSSGTNAMLWDQTTASGTNTVNGVYIQKNLTQLIPGYSTTNPPPWQINNAVSINDAGVIAANGIYSGTNTAIPHGPHGLVLLPIAITPSTIPTTGVARAKIEFGSGVQVPTVNSSSQLAITIGGQNVTDIDQDPNNPNIFYFAVPPGTAGSADVTVSGISVPGMPWLSATPPQTMTLPNLVQYTSDPVQGTQGFSQSNCVSIKEAKSVIDYQVQQGTITSSQAADVFSDISGIVHLTQED